MQSVVYKRVVLFLFLEIVCRVTTRVVATVVEWIVGTAYRRLRGHGHLEHRADDINGGMPV